MFEFALTFNFLLVFTDILAEERSPENYLLACAQLLFFTKLRHTQPLICRRCLGVQKTKHYVALPLHQKQKEVRFCMF